MRNNNLKSGKQNSKQEQANFPSRNQLTSNQVMQLKHIDSSKDCKHEKKSINKQTNLLESHSIYHWT